jgi:hypothetical protein
MINLSQTKACISYTQLTKALRSKRPRDAQLTNCLQGNGQRIFYSYHVCSKLATFLSEYLRDIRTCEPKVDELLSHHPQWYVATQGHFIVEYYSSCVRNKSQQKFHRDVSNPSSLWALFIHLEGEDLNTHFSTPPVIARTPVFLYDTFDEHAGPASVRNVAHPIYIKDRVQLYISHSMEQCVQGCVEHGLKRCNVHTLSVGNT